jgi:transposase InsO family protein
MAWKKVLPMDERRKFVLEADLDICTFSGLCEKYGISRKTGYKWYNRYLGDGFDGLAERSHAARHCPHRTDCQIEELILEQRERHPKWGPKKLAVRLIKENPGLIIPAPSTIGEVLKRRGQIKPRRRRRNWVRKWPGALTKPERPNHVWATDFKGWFRLGNARRCDPLTISDLSTRYILGCSALQGQTMELSKPVFKRVFRKMGLPEVIRVDNGAPFGSNGVLGLTSLSMWWVQLGIRVEFIEPGHPEQNGCHERMHRTLKAETSCPPEHNARMQQKRFDSWRMEFNYERPHEALDMLCPGDLYKPSPNRYPRRINDFNYPSYFEVRRVREAGQIVWDQRPRFIGHAFYGILVGLEPIDGEYWRVHAGDLVLGTLKYDSSERLRPTVSASRNQSKKR